MAGDDTTTAAAAAAAAIFPSPIYREVKAWIAQKEAYELEHNKAAPLTSAQRNALETLRMPSNLLPTVGNTNWVGFLNEYRQATSPSGEIEYMESESGTILAGGTKGRTCRVLVDDMLLRGMAGGCCFPCPGSGLLPVPRTAATANSAGAGGANGDDDNNGRLTIPVFATKKMAKQYAAKCAVEFLTQHGHMLEDIRAKIERRVARDEASPEVAAGATTAVGSVPFPPPGESPPPSSSSFSSPAPSPSAQLKRGNDNVVDDDDGDEMGEGDGGESNNNNNNDDDDDTRAAQHSHPPPSKRRNIVPGPDQQHTIEPIASSTASMSTNTTAIPANAPKLVAALCQKLGFPPPKYVISFRPSSSRPPAPAPVHSLFDGHPEFANHAGDEELTALRAYATLAGVAAPGPGADAAKNAVAGRLLVRLREIEAERRAALEEAMRRG